MLELFSSGKTEAELGPEERIRRAALVCIETSGLEGVTVRSIAAEAGMNPAAVNYYFRSKDRLIEETLREAWSHFVADIDKIMGSTISEKEKLSASIGFIMEGARRYPRILRAVLAEHPVLSALAAEYTSGFVARLSDGFDAGKDPAIATTLLLAFGVFLGFAPESVSRIAVLDMGTEEGRRALAKRLAEVLFPES